MHALYIVLYILLGLVAVPGAIATIRAILGKAATFNPTTDIEIAMKRAAEEWWFHRCLVTFDISCNVMLLRGQQDETISTHSWRAAQEGKLWGKLMSGWLNWFQPNHGIKAASGDLERATVRVAVLKKALGLS